MNKLVALLDGRKRLLGQFVLVVYAGLVATGTITRNTEVEWLITAVLGVGYADAVRKV